jgi:hypothetical protein
MGSYTGQIRRLQSVSFMISKINDWVNSIVNHCQLKLIKAQYPSQKENLSAQRLTFLYTYIQHQKESNRKHKSASVHPSLRQQRAEKVAKVITGGKNEARKVDSLKAKEAFGSAAANLVR